MQERVAADGPPAVGGAEERSPHAPPGAAFGEAPLPARPLDRGLGLAVARLVVFRLEDGEDFGRVADRVAEGNMALLGRAPAGEGDAERARLRNAIATGALLTAGRHLQHGDAMQPHRPMELFVNCATAIASFAEFYLLLSGAGVGRAYDDELMAVDWAEAPELLLHLSPEHPDHPRGPAARLRPGADPDAPAPDVSREAELRASLARELLADPAEAPADAARHRVEDSREGWAAAVELLEAMAFRRERGKALLLDLSAIRPAGAPIRGLQGRPAPGPLPLLRALAGIRRQVIEPARARDPAGEALRPWEQALLVDHLLSAEVLAGGTRRAARMATKSWRDPGASRFARLKRGRGLWTGNHSLMVDREFWDRVRQAEEDPASAAADPLTRQAASLFQEATRSAFATGEPGFLNADMLEDVRAGTARPEPPAEPGSGFGSARFRVSAGAGLLEELSCRGVWARFPVTTNPCGEVVLRVTGGYCVVADFAPLLACPAPLGSLVPGAPPPDLAVLWDARVEDAVRLGVRFLIRVNLMDGFYAREVRRTNRIGIGPTGLHEWAWARFGLGFRDLLDEARSAAFWAMLARLGEAAKVEASAYAAALGLNPPLTVTTVKPSGTVSKLFGLSEGAHLPSRRHYLRWVQFRGERDAAGAWRPGSDPPLADYAARGYPVRPLRGVPGACIVGFPTVPLALRLGMGDRLVTAGEAEPEEHYRWLRLLERHWIGAERGNQVSYTMRLSTDRMDLAAFRRLVLDHQPGVRGCAVLPLRPGPELGYEYLPEEEVPADRFAAIVAAIRDPGLREAVDTAMIPCPGGVCPS